MNVQISAVIITFNEERNIQRCLESLNGVVDEIVVVDSYSTDRTEEICNSFRVKFIKHRFTGHIEQKNWAILQASFPYILALDADEALSDLLRESILKVKENWKYDGYYFNRLTNYCGKWIRHTTWYPSRKLRLWDARKGSWGGFNPHDKFFLRKGSNRQFLKGDILHYSYYSVNEHLVQINTFSTILARSYYERGRRAFVTSLLLHPLWRFIKDFIFRSGFLDGYFGFIVSVNSAHEVFMKYVKLWNLHHEAKESLKKTICLFNSMGSWGGGEKWHHDIASYLVALDNRVIYISSPGSLLAKRMKELGISGHMMRIVNLSFINPVKLLRLIWIFKKEKVGVVVTNLSRDMKVASLAAKIAGVPKIIYRRGSAIPVSNSILNRYLFRKVITQVLANSQETKRTILVNNPALVSERKIKVIYNSINLPKYHQDVEPLYKAEEGVIVLGSAGRLSEEKGHLYLLEMLAELAKSDVQFKLLIAGKGRLLHSLEKKARKLGIFDQVEFLGFVENMPAFFKSLDIFLLSSHYEGFGYVIAEAMASYKPVVAFDIKSSTEIIVHGETGYVTQQNSAQDLAQRVLGLARDKSLCEEMGKAGRNRVEDLFSYEKNKQEILEIIAQSKDFESPAAF